MCKQCPFWMLLKCLMSNVLCLMSDMNIIVKKSIANNEILSSELEVNVGFGIRLQSYTVTNTELYNIQGIFCNINVKGHIFY